MDIRDWPYTHSEEEFSQMRELLVDSYTRSSRPHNWRLASIENWNYASRYLEPPEYFTDRVRLWRAGDGELLSFLIRYYDTTYLQVDHRFRDLEPRMLVWAEENWVAEDALQTKAFEYDVVRQNLLMERGYVDLGPTEYVRLYDLKKSRPSPALPDAFRVASVGELGDTAGRIALERAIWGHDILDEAWFRGKSSAPNYSLDWDMVVISPDKVQVAACLVWIDARNRAAEIDPLGVHPDFRRRGLARAVVLESFRRLADIGVGLVFIASSFTDTAANNFYVSLVPNETYIAHTWVKRC
jgi:mycothiol synthase